MSENSQNNTSLSTSHWSRLHSHLEIKGSYKQQPEHFIVEEVIDFPLTDSGEHSWLWVEKIEQNTAFVAEQLAKFSGVPLRNIGYAGRKDKYALTRQWFSVYHANKPVPDWSKWTLPGCQILKATKHEKKLKTGALSGNRFELKVQLTSRFDESDLKQRMDDITAVGVPNYFGQQRFGEMKASDGQVYFNGNLDMASRMINGEEIRNRNKKSMAISALRSWLFNEVISQRIKRFDSSQILLGDALKLSGTRSFFIAQESDMQRNNERLSQGDVEITGPLWGKGEPDSKQQAQQFELDVAQQFPNVTACLERLLERQERRAAMLLPEDLKYTLDGEWLTLRFTLPSGAFATSVLREIVDI